MATFPRRVPREAPRFNKKLVNRILGAGVLSPFVVGGVMEYMGWLRHLDPPDKNSAEGIYVDTTIGDRRAIPNTYRETFFQKVDVLKKDMNQAFVDSAPVGLKKFIEDPDFTKSESGDTNIFNTPLLRGKGGVLKGDDLITFTSSKKSPESDATSSNTSTSSNKTESEIKS